MMASAENGFASVKFDPAASTCTMISRGVPPRCTAPRRRTRRVPARRTRYNVAYSDEIGHFEYCAKVDDSPFGSACKPLGFDTNNPDNGGP